MKKKAVKRLIDKELRKSMSQMENKHDHDSDNDGDGEEKSAQGIDLIFPIHPQNTSGSFDGTESPAHPFFDGRAGA